MDHDTGKMFSLPVASRKKIILRILDTLQRKMPLTEPEVLLKVAENFEEKIFRVTSDQQDYLRKISLKMLSLEASSHPSTPVDAVEGQICQWTAGHKANEVEINSLGRFLASSNSSKKLEPSDQGTMKEDGTQQEQLHFEQQVQPEQLQQHQYLPPPQDSLPPTNNLLLQTHSLQEPRQPNSLRPGHQLPSGDFEDSDERELVWQKIQKMKDMYLKDMKDLYSMLVARITMPMSPEQFSKLMHYSDVLHRIIPYLTGSKEKLPWDFTQSRVETVEKQIVNIMEIFKRRNCKTLDTQQSSSNHREHHMSALTHLEGDSPHWKINEVLFSSPQILQAPPSFQRSEWRLHPIANVQASRSGDAPSRISIPALGMFSPPKLHVIYSSIHDVKWAGWQLWRSSLESCLPCLVSNDGDELSGFYWKA